MTPTAPLTPLAAIRNPEVRALANEAQAFLTSHHWCQGISEGSLAFATAGVLAVFFFRIISTRADVDSALWVVVGDLPPAYFVCDNIDSWQDVLGAYVDHMQDWVDAVRQARPTDSLIPVLAAPTIAHADMLASRLEFIREHFLNVSPDDLESDN